MQSELLHVISALLHKSRQLLASALGSVFDSNLCSCSLGPYTFGSQEMVKSVQNPLTKFEGKTHHPLQH
jgi:hypothetical protein